MIRTAALAAAVARDLERKAAARAAHGARRMALAAAAGFLLLGTLIFASVGLVLVLAGPLGPGGATFLVAAIWLFLAVAALIVVMLDQRRRKPPMTPDVDPVEVMAALRTDFGKGAPVLAVAAVVAGFLAAGRR
jgi:hypothetical protein